MTNLLFLQIRIFLRGRNNQIVAAFSQDLGNRLGNFGKEGMQQIRDNQPDEIAASSNQTASRQVGAIIQLFDAGENAFAGFIADIGVITKDFRDRNDGYAKIPGDVFHPCAHIEGSIPKDRSAGRADC